MLAGLLTVMGMLRLWSPGKPAPFVSSDGRVLPGSIAEKTFSSINGIDQGMFIKGRDISNPILLYLHGGLPDYFLTHWYPTGLEDLFTVVWWEMRGSGLSYHPHASPESVTAEQLVSDTLAMTDYLRSRFEKDKIYLMGHSGGTFIGIQAAARAPERYLAYIGVGQISDQLRSERRAHRYMVDEYRHLGDNRMARALEAAPVTDAGNQDRAYLSIRDMAMHRLRIGTTHDMTSVLTGIVYRSWRFPEYTIAEKANLWRGKFRSGVSSVWGEIITTDLATELTRLETPAYFMSGLHDYTVNYELSRDYLERLEAPVKGFYTFPESAHSPMFEEAERMREILQSDVLQGRNLLADEVGRAKGPLSR